MIPGAAPGMVSPELIQVYDLLLAKFVSAGVLYQQEGSSHPGIRQRLALLVDFGGTLSSKLVDLASEELQLAITGAVYRASKTTRPSAFPRLRITLRELRSMLT